MNEFSTVLTRGCLGEEMENKKLRKKKKEEMKKNKRQKARKSQKKIKRNVPLISPKKTTC